MAIKEHFTDAKVTAWIAAAKATPGKRVEYQDTKVPYLQLRVTSAGGTFTGYLWHPTKKTPVRETFAKTTVMNVAQARDKARIFGSDTRAGVDVAAQKREARDAADRGRLSIKDMHTQDMAKLEAEGTPLRPSSVDMYDTELQALFGDLYDAPFDTITEDKLRALIVERKRKRTVTTKTGGSRVVGSPFGARVACDRMSTLCVRFKVPDPSASLRQTWAAFPTTNNGTRDVGRVDTVQLGPLFAWLLKFREEASTTPSLRTQSTMMLLSLATGWRRFTLQQLRWEYFDWKAMRITIPGEVTKTHKPHVIPMARVIAQHIFPGSRPTSGLMFTQEKDADKLADFFPRFLQLLPIRCSSQDFRQSALALFDDAPGAGAFGAKLLLGHNNGDVSFVNYMKKTALPVRLRKMEAVVEYVDAQLSAHIGNKKTLRAMDLLHSERFEAMLERERVASANAKARARAKRDAKRAAAAAATI